MAERFSVISDRLILNKTDQTYYTNGRNDGLSKAPEGKQTTDGQTYDNRQTMDGQTYETGHSRVPKTFTIKMRLSAEPFL